MKTKKTLYIPVNIRKRKELIDGFGMKEVMQTVILAVVGLVIGLILFFLNNHQILYLTIVPIIFAMGTIVFVKKDKRNMNTVDQIKLAINFMNSQKTYHYKYYNIYEREVVDGKE